MASDLVDGRSDGGAKGVHGRRQSVSDETDRVRARSDQQHCRTALLAPQNGLRLVRPAAAELRATEADFSWEAVRASGVDESGGPATRSLSDLGVGHGPRRPTDRRSTPRRTSMLYP